MASIRFLGAASAHGDHAEVSRWLATLPARPRRVFRIHGEPPALAARAERLRAQGMTVEVPAHLQEFTLGE